VTRVIRSDLPAHSLLHGYIQTGDFLDCYACHSHLDVDTAAARAMNFPLWAKGLLRLRNIAAVPLGLRAAMLRGETAANCIGPFPIDQRNGSEVILGFDDDHLNFRISILCGGGRAFGATWVHRNNALGRAYLAAIMPFHILVMRNAMRQVASAAQAN
jgi:Protein of unknown function (DUF2867)